MSEELKHALGKPSTYHSGPDPSDAENQTKQSAKPTLADLPDEHKQSMLDHLKSVLGIAGKEAVPNGGLDALNKGIADAE
jgi:hypothetical protein